MRGCALVLNLFEGVGRATNGLAWHTKDVWPSLSTCYPYVHFVFPPLLLPGTGNCSETIGSIPLLPRIPKSCITLSSLSQRSMGS